MISFLRSIDRVSWFNRNSAIPLLLVVPLYFNFKAYDTTQWEKFLVAHLIVIRMVAGWLYTVAQDRETGGRTLLDLPIVLYLCLVAFSWMSAINPLRSGMEVIRVLLAAAIFFSVSRTYTEGSRVVWLRAVSLSLGLVSFAGVCQYSGIGFLDWRSAGLPSSTFFYRNYAAMFVAIVLPVSFCAIALALNDTERILHGIAGTLGTIFLIYTRTRGAWLGVLIGVIGVALVLYLIREESDAWIAWSEAIQRGRRVLSVCGLVVLCAILLPPSDVDELETLPMAKSSAATAFVSILAGEGSGRSTAWLQSLQMIADHPFGGVGIGNWDAEYLRYAGEANRQDGGLFGRPHNDYVWTVTELGIPGLALYVWIIVGGLWLVWQQLLRGGDRECIILMTALGAGIIAISVHAFFSFPRERMAATVIPYLFLGWIAALGPRADTVRLPILRRSWKPALILALACVTLGPTLRVTWAYRAYFWADAYRTFDRFEDALVAIDGAVDFGVVDYRFYELKALIHMKLGDPRGALAASEATLDYHPHNPWNFHKVGLFRLQLGDVAGAKDAFTRALSLGPGLGIVRRDLGQTYERLGMADSAMVAYEAALPRIPRDALLRTRMAGLLARQEDFESAQEHIAVAADRLRLTTVHADVAVVGDVAMQARAYDAAVKAYGRAHTVAADNGTYARKLAEAYLAAGQPDQARAVYLKLLDLIPEAEQELIRGRIEMLDVEQDG